jgi:hypothetical protein
MEIFNSIAEFLNKLFQWWFIVMPWEQAVFIRKGKNVKLLNAGIYFRIPFIDTVYIQTTRMRMIDLSVQTMSTRDGQTITIKSAVGYTIENVETLFNTMSHPEMTLGSMVMSYIAEYVSNNDCSAITPTKLETEVDKKMFEMKYGLKDINVRITTFAKVRTFRLIQDSSGLWEGLDMQPKK